MFEMVLRGGAVQQDKCKDMNGNCTHWGKAECKNNPIYMQLYCAKTCDSCDKVKVIERHSLPGFKEASMKRLAEQDKALRQASRGVAKYKEEYKKQPKKVFVVIKSTLLFGLESILE